MASRCARPSLDYYLEPFEPILTLPEQKCNTTLSVSAIRDGTVIDHIQVGQALSILRLLRLHCHHKQISLGLHLKSRSMGRKDLIKIEDWIASPEEVAQIALFSPHATVNLIQEYRVSNKLKVQLPASIRAVFHCPNPRCITHAEVMETHFTVEEKGTHLFFHCTFCEKLFPREDMKPV